MKPMSQPLHEAEYYEILDEDNNVLQCKLCPIECTMLMGEKGKCLARKNIDGKLYSLTYGATDMKIDMIEKQHVYHFLPNSRAQTFSTYNCNLDCDYCTMPEKARQDPEQYMGKRFAPEQVAMFGIASGSRVICFGEAEPMISFEWVRDSAKLAKERGLKVLIRTNGFFNREPIEAILDHVDAVTLDIKSVSNEGYEKNCQRGNFEHIKSIIKLIFEKEKLLELNLVIHESLGNTLDETRKLADWIKTELSPAVPLHLARLLPAHRLKEISPTPKSLLEEAYTIAKEVGLHFVYLDNVPDHKANNTYCPTCDELLIQRTSTITELRRISLTGNCNKCETQLKIVFK